MTSLKPLDKIRAVIRTKHYSYRTEQTYVRWITRYIYYHGKRHPEELTGQHINAYLSYLATDRQVAASTQNQAKHALLFLYREALQREIEMPEVSLFGYNCRLYKSPSVPLSDWFINSLI